MESAPQEPHTTPAPAAIPPAFDWLRLGWKPAVRKPETPAVQALPALVPFVLTLEDAGILYVALRAKIRPDARTKPSTARPAADLVRLLEILETTLRKLPATSPATTILTLDLASRDAAYLDAMVGNMKRDKWRRKQVRNRGVVSLDALAERAEAADESSTGRNLKVPADSDRPDRAFGQAEIKHALAGLPNELAALLGPLAECGGNVSELARRLGQPQRKTARQVARIRKRLEKLGLGPV